MAAERVVWYLWADSLVLAIPKKIPNHPYAAILLAEVVGWERDYSSSTMTDHGIGKQHLKMTKHHPELIMCRKQPRAASAGGHVVY